MRCFSPSPFNPIQLYLTQLSFRSQSHKLATNHLATSRREMLWSLAASTTFSLEAAVSVTGVCFIISLTKVNVDGGTVTSAWVLTFIDFMQCLIFKLIQWDRNAKNMMSGSAKLDGNVVILESTPSLRLVPTCTVPSWYLL